MEWVWEEEEEEGEGEEEELVSSAPPYPWLYLGPGLPLPGVFSSASTRLLDIRMETRTFGGGSGALLGFAPIPKQQL